MQITIESLAVMAYLLPGFISSAFLDELVDRPKKETAEKIVEALVFSFFIYALISLFSDQSPVTITKPPGEHTIPVTTFNGAVIGWVLGLAVLLPLVLSKMKMSDWPMKCLRACGFTAMISQPIMWVLTFQAQKQCWITVHMKNGDRIYGWPRYYSTSSEKRSIYVVRPYLIMDDNSSSKLNADGLLLLDEDIYYIEFHK